MTNCRTVKQVPMQSIRNWTLYANTITGGCVHISLTSILLYERGLVNSMFFQFIYTTIYIWANYNNSLTWNKAILGWFPLLSMIPVRSQWGRYNLPRYIYVYIYMWGGYCLAPFHIQGIPGIQLRTTFRRVMPSRVRHGTILGSQLPLKAELSESLEVNSCHPKNGKWYQDIGLIRGESNIYTYIYTYILYIKPFYINM